MRKLTVKNFSVIKEAELEFGKITVLIGPQSSGKSLLCKLAYFFQKTLFELAANHAVAILDDKRWARFLGEDFQKSFCNFFPPYSWGRETFEITYEDGSYHARVAFSDSPSNRQYFNDRSKLDLSVSKAFQKVFDDYGRQLVDLVGEMAPSDRSAYLLGRVHQVEWQFRQLQSDPTFSVHSYIPDQRSIFATDNPRYAASANRSSDPIAIQFAMQVDYEFRKNLPPTGNTAPIHFFDQFSRKVLGGSIVMDEGSGTPRFREKDGRQLPLPELSSGTRELLPLFAHLEQYVFEENANYWSILGLPQRQHQTDSLPESLIYVEEPETHVFPSTQYEIVRLFAWMSNEPMVNLSWVITTHSPYIMTAFNTLMEAGRVGSAPRNREKVIALIPEKYWIQEKDFKAYAIEDGILVSIFKPEAEDPEAAGMINGDYLDSVSDQLGKEFDRLLDIEYAE